MGTIKKIKYLARNNRKRHIQHVHVPHITSHNLMHLQTAAYYFLQLLISVCVPSKFAVNQLTELILDNFRVVLGEQSAKLIQQKTTTLQQLSPCSHVYKFTVFACVCHNWSPNASIQGSPSYKKIRLGHHPTVMQTTTILPDRQNLCEHGTAMKSSLVHSVHSITCIFQLGLVPNEVCGHPQRISPVLAYLYSFLCRYITYHLSPFIISLAP